MRRPAGTKMREREERRKKKKAALGCIAWGQQNRRKLWIEKKKHLKKASDVVGRQ